MQNYRFHVDGIHCSSCKMLIEQELEELEEVHGVKVDLKSRTVDVEGTFEESAEELLERFNPILLKLHYKLSLERKATKVAWGEFTTAIPAAGVFIALFLLLQKLGVVNWVNSGEVSLSTAFMIGIIASLSTCMAMVGGLVLSVSANFAKGGQRVRPQLFFHVGRLVSFFVLGGAIGVLGSFLEFNTKSTFVLNMLVGVVMLVLGLNLLDVIPSLKRFQPTLPSFLAKPIRQLRELNHSLTPLLLGIATFFLPCGFTQSMQLYSLSSGSFWSGSLTMLSFALGTLPVLSLLSFSSFALENRKQSGVFFKAAGLVVLFFALFNIMSSLVAMGLIDPFINF